ncbi:MAG: DUF192 domain-containing protein [Endomicrobia bacterium]|nr:DUF192 domain-containing protein [Endomicrobiia bacterium]MCL2800095.1 DUF192 domain-containing protein [Endomicrobiia bacterium]
MKKAIKVFILLILPFFVFTACLTAGKAGIPKIYNDGSEINAKIAGKKFRLTVAKTQEARAQGLSDRDKMPADGMIFLFDASQPLTFWMKNMRFPIDILWINGNKIVAITKNARPEPGVSDENLKRYFSGYYADTVIELNAGDCEKYNIKTGDAVVIPASERE